MDKVIKVRSKTIHPVIKGFVCPNASDAFNAHKVVRSSGSFSGVDSPAQVVGRVRNNLDASVIARQMKSSSNVSTSNGEDV